jgi:hypothetical protein
MVQANSWPRDQLPRRQRDGEYGSGLARQVAVVCCHDHHLAFAAGQAVFGNPVLLEANSKRHRAAPERRTTSGDSGT